MDTLSCFTAYDIRGDVGVTLDEAIARRIGRAYSAWLRPARVVIGGDNRLSTAGLKQALADGLQAGGAEVIDIGMVGTEEVYFATRALHACGGIQVTASHNPAHYNGMKLVREGAKPISGDSGLPAIRALAEANVFPVSPAGRYRQLDHRTPYIDHLLSYLHGQPLRPLRVVVNAGNGAAGPILDALEQRLRLMGSEMTWLTLHHAPDGHFPHGVPNPMLPENRAATQAAIRRYRADIGLAWDGDADRCFIFDERGEYLEGCYVVSLLAEALLARAPGETILHDPRLIWAARETITQCGGIALETKTGHAFMKERMRQENALYGGEMSGHHYFRAFGYCDSGMIPALLMLQLLGERPQPLSAWVAALKARFPVSGEINCRVEDPAQVMRTVEAHYRAEGVVVSHTDGLSMAFAAWRFNLRRSNTEPLLRLNVETRGDRPLMQAKTSELLALIAPSPAAGV
ncbi:phosphomannomutase CpsG [Chimaeribacter arupi]|uniref:phosphomannomutase CpsG n=1 Tax=Chimaeribacter arupi TaxID=2060066 RepID=UPI002711FBCD|nr:phosphomannomutase CpsG [Chimaeribacter arupi]WKZ92187.1 phosphomannomutase CpsG [Chimaeribacter arupi]